MRTPASGGPVHNSSASATGRHAEIYEDARRGMGVPSYVLLIAISAGCFLLACAAQPWLKDSRFQPRPEQMQAGLAADPAVAPQQFYSQRYQYGVQYPSVRYAAPPLSYQYGINGQRDMRIRTDIDH